MTTKSDLHIVVLPGDGIGNEIMEACISVLEKLEQKIGGMGMAPCAEIGENHGLFQPSHGSAPDIAGTDKANPTAMMLSAAMMLDWLGMKHGIDACKTASRELENDVEKGFETGKIRPIEFGGPHGTVDVMKAVIELI